MAKKNTKAKKVEIVPLSDRVLIKPIDETEEKTASGIYLPESSREKSQTKKGTVVAVGDGKYDDGKLNPMTVKKGDTVIYGWGDTIEIQDEEYVLVKESEISAIIK